MSPSVIAPMPVWMTLTPTSGWSIFESSPTTASIEPWTSALTMMLSSRIAPSSICVKRSSRETPFFDPRASCSARTRWPRSLREMARLAVVLDHVAVLSGGRRLVEAEDLDRRAGARLLDLLASEVEERAHLAPGVAGDDGVADPEGAAHHEHRRDRAAADVEAALDDRPGGLRLGVRLQLQLGVGDEQDALDEVVEPLPGLRRHVRELRRAAPLLRLEPVRGEILAHLLRVRVRLVDLVHGDDDRHLGGACVVDRLDRLRHDAVVGRDHEHSDVRHLGAAGAERGERLVARRVEERHAPAVVVDLVGADVLRDAAGLRLHDGAFPDGVEQRRLAVVDVTHDRDDRRTCREVVGVVLVRLRLELLLVGVLDLDFLLGLRRDQLDGFVRERLRDGDHLADAHHDLDDLGDGHAERGGQLLDRRARVDLDGPGRRRRRRLRLARRLLDAVALRAVGARAGGLRVDDHAALAAASRRAAPRSQWSLAISHGASLVLLYRRFQSRRDGDGSSQRAGERPARRGLLEARADGDRCRRPCPGASDPRPPRARPPAPRSARARTAAPCDRTRRTS